MRVCKACGKKYQNGISFCPKDGQRLEVSLSLDGSDDDPLLGITIDKKYHIETKIAEGGMSNIYLANHLQLDMPVAVKVMHERLVPDAIAIRRFRREAQSAMQIRHTNAITVMDFGVTENNLVYLVMEYLQGKTLREKLREERLLPLVEVHTIMQQICAAVRVAHRRNIIHRDLKPENIFLQLDGDTEIVKVLDFGIAKLDNFCNPEQLTQIGNVIGSPIYMSPEQFGDGEIDVRSDVYALGILLFELLTGQVPFTATSLAALAYKHTSEAPPSITALRPDLPPSIEMAVLRALDKDRNNRPEDAGALGEELRDAFSSLFCIRETVNVFSEPSVPARAPAPTASPTDDTVTSNSSELLRMYASAEWPTLTVPDSLDHMESSYQLDSFFLPEFFGMMARDRVSGITWFSSGLTVKGIFWRDGEIIFAISNDQSERFGERLVRQGRILRQQLNEAIRWRGDRELSIIDALIGIGFIAPDNIVPLLNAHVYSICYSLMDWEEGCYAFDPTISWLPTAVNLPVGELILEALRSVIDMGRIRVFLGDPAHSSLEPVDWKDCDKVLLRPDEQDVLERFTERQTIAQVLAQHDLPEEQVLRTVAALLSLGALQRCETETTETINLEAETASQELEQLAKRSSIEMMSLFCYEVENMLGQVNRAGSDLYAVLGLAPQASREEIETTYQQLVDKFDAERNSRVIEMVPTLASQLETIQRRLNEAYNTLSDARERVKYTQQLKEKSGHHITVTPAMITNQPQDPPAQIKSRVVRDDAKPAARPTLPESSRAATASSQQGATNVRAGSMPSMTEQKPKPPGPSGPMGPMPLSDPSRLRNPDDWYLLGIDLLDRGEADKAARAFQNAVKRRPKDAEFHAALARAYSQVYGYNDQTINEFEEAIQLQPKSADYQAELGSFYLEHNKLEQASTCIDKALQLDASNKMARRAKQRLEQQVGK